MLSTYGYDSIHQTKDNIPVSYTINQQSPDPIYGLDPGKRPHSVWSIKRPELYINTMISNMGCNHKSNMYHKNSGKLNICADDLNNQYLMTLKWYQTIDTLLSSEMLAMKILIDNHTDINADTVKWMNHLAFSAKSKSGYKLTWNEFMNVPQKEGYWSA